MSRDTAARYATFLLVSSPTTPQRAKSSRIRSIRRGSSSSANRRGALAGVDGLGGCLRFRLQGSRDLFVLYLFQLAQQPLQVLADYVLFSPSSMAACLTNAVDWCAA